LQNFEQEGCHLLSNIQYKLSQSSNQKDFGEAATDILGRKVLPHGWVGLGKKLAKKKLSGRKRSIEIDCANQADQWLDPITMSLKRISKLTSSITLKGNSSILIRKLNHAKSGIQAGTKIKRGLKALEEINQMDLIYNYEIRDMLQVKKLNNISSSRYNQYSNDAKLLLKNYPSELEAFLGAIERLEHGGLDAYRQCLSSCRNSIESLVKKIAQRWPDGLNSIIRSDTKRKIIKNTYQYLSAYGVHGTKTPTEDDAKSGLEQTISSLRQIISNAKKGGLV